MVDSKPEFHTRLPVFPVTSLIVVQVRSLSAFRKQEDDHTREHTRGAQPGYIGTHTFW
jgi:hypothetical protein